MNIRTLLFNALALFVLFVCSSIVVAGAGEAVRKPAGWHSGVGASFSSDPATAGEEAASLAKAGLGDVEPKLVMVMGARPLVTDAMLEGVKQYFPAEIIYGSEVTSIWTYEGNNADSKELDTVVGVAVWAVGGDVDVTVASVETDSGEEDDTEVRAYYQAGFSLAEELSPALENSTRPGRLMVTWGDQFTGSNKAFARGLNDAFGAIWPVVGGAAGGAEAKVIVQGHITMGVNVGVVLAGDFRIGQTKRTGPHTPHTAELAFQDALKEGNGEAPFFGLLFNCRRRRVGMMNEGTLAAEHEVARKFFPGGEFFGFYAPGEIGSASPGEPPEGVGFSVTAAFLYAN